MKFVANDELKKVHSESTLTSEKLKSFGGKFNQMNEQEIEQYINTVQFLSSILIEEYFNKEKLWKT